MDNESLIQRLIPLVNNNQWESVAALTTLYSDQCRAVNFGIPLIERAIARANTDAPERLYKLGFQFNLTEMTEILASTECGLNIYSQMVTLYPCKTLAFTDALIRRLLADSNRYTLSSQQKIMFLVDREYPSEVLSPDMLARFIAHYDDTKRILTGACITHLDRTHNLLEIIRESSHFRQPFEWLKALLLITGELTTPIFNSTWRDGDENHLLAIGLLYLRQDLVDAAAAQSIKPDFNITIVFKTLQSIGDNRLHRKGFTPPISMLSLNNSVTRDRDLLIRRKLLSDLHDYSFDPHIMRVESLNAFWHLGLRYAACFKDENWAYLDALCFARHLPTEQLSTRATWLFAECLIQENNLPPETQYQTCKQFLLAAIKGFYDAGHREFPKESGLPVFGDFFHYTSWQESLFLLSALNAIYHWELTTADVAEALDYHSDIEDAASVAEPATVSHIINTEFPTCTPDKWESARGGIAPRQSIRKIISVIRRHYNKPLRAPFVRQILLSIAPPQLHTEILDAYAIGSHYKLSNDWPFAAIMKAWNLTPYEAMLTLPVKEKTRTALMTAII